MYHVAVEARQRIWIRLHPKTLALGASGYSTGNLAGFWLPVRIVDLSVVNPECFFLDPAIIFRVPNSDPSPTRVMCYLIQIHGAFTVLVLKI